MNFIFLLFIYSLINLIGSLKISISKLRSKLLARPHSVCFPLHHRQYDHFDFLVCVLLKSWANLKSVDYQDHLNKIVDIIIDEMALYRFFTGTAVSAKTQKHDVFLKPTVPVKNRYKAISSIIMQIKEITTSIEIIMTHKVTNGLLSSAMISCSFSFVISVSRLLSVNTFCNLFHNFGEVCELITNLVSLRKIFYFTVKFSKLQN